MSIYCQQALGALDSKSAQRVLRCLAKTQWLQTEKEDSKEQRVVLPQIATSLDIGIFKVEYPIDTDPSDILDATQQSYSITQEDYGSPPASNTGSIVRDQSLKTKCYTLWSSPDTSPRSCPTKLQVERTLSSSYVTRPLCNPWQQDRQLTQVPSFNETP